MSTNSSQIATSTIDSLSIASVPSSSAAIGGEDRSTLVSLLTPKCHGVFHDAVLAVFAALFVLFLAFRAKKNLKKLYNGRSHVMISYYALLWTASVLNLAWCCLQAWQCSPGKEFAWNLLSLLTTSAMLYLEISLAAFLLQHSYISGLEALAHTFSVSGIIVSLDVIFKVICAFGFSVPLFIDHGENMRRAKWGLWIVHKLLLTGVYAYILFVHFPKWREYLPPRPAFYNYAIVMFVTNAVALLACGLALFKAGFGIWLYSFTVICFHSLYLPFIYVTFLADFFQEEDFLLDNAYYSEMKDAGFLDADWD